MSERGFSDVLKETLAAMAPALKNAGAEIGAELSRLGTQGSMELASALFGNGAFVPYGPGQYTATPEAGKGSQDQEIQKAEPHQEQERGGREM
jgi:hypothetical protein